MAKNESKQAKQERLDINKQIGRAKKLARADGLKKGKKRGYWYGTLASFAGAIIIGGGAFATVVIIDYVQHQNDTPDKKITVKELGTIVLLPNQKIPSAEQVAVAILTKNPNFNIKDFKIKDIKVDGVKSTAKVVSSHWFVKGSVEVTFSVSSGK